MFKHIIESLRNLSTSIDSISNLNSFIDNIKKHINLIIESIHKILLQSVKYISYAIRIIEFYFNVLLEIYYKLFIKKLNDQKSSLEKNIKQYIGDINTSLKEHSSSVQKLIQSITENVKNLDTNKGRLDQFNQYKKGDDLIKPGTPFEHPRDTPHFKKIFEAHEAYKKCLQSYPDITPELSKFTRILIHYNSLVKNTGKTLCKYYDSLTDSSTIEERINSLKKIKTFYVDKFINNIHYVKELEEIGVEINKQISTMKFNLSEVQNKVDDRAKTYIETLKEIEVDPSQVKTDIIQIKWMNDNIIEMLQIEKHNIDFYNSLNEEIRKLNGVKFEKYNINEFLTNSHEIKEKLKKFQEQIKSHLETLKSSFGEISGDSFVMEGDIYTQSYYENLVKPVENLINNLSQEISTIRYMVYCLLIIKSNSIIIQFVRNKINEINDTNSSLTKLTEILKDLTIFYLIHRNSMNVVLLLNSVSFARQYINEYVNNLTLLKYYTEILIFTIKCYIIILTVIQYVTGELNKIKQQIEKLISESTHIKKLGYTSNIKKYLESINLSIKSLESVNKDLDINNLKNNMSIIKNQIRQVYLNTHQIEVNINEINNLLLKLYIIYFKIIYIKKYIENIIIKINIFINYLYGYMIIVLLISKGPEISEEKKLVFIIHSNSIFKLMENLIKIVDYLSRLNLIIEKIGIKELIENIESQTGSTETLVNNIQLSVDKINKGVVGVEYAIEGVPRNLTCSLQCVIDNSTSRIINDNMVNITFYSPY